jgi:hypothetical protein
MAVSLLALRTRRTLLPRNGGKHGGKKKEIGSEWKPRKKKTDKEREAISERSGAETKYRQDKRQQDMRKCMGIGEKSET